MTDRILVQEPDEGNNGIFEARRVPLEALMDELVANRATAVEIRLAYAIWKRAGAEPVRLSHPQLFVLARTESESLQGAKAQAEEHAVLIIDRTTTPHTYQIAPRLHEAVSSA